MDKNIIENYINFGINNGYSNRNGFDVVFDYDYYFEGFYFQEGNSLNKWHIYEIITSKQFIEAVARGILKIGEEGTLPKGSSKHMKRKGFLYFLSGGISNIIGFTECEKNNAINYIIDGITESQAIAIRDEKLEEFINNLIN